MLSPSLTEAPARRAPNWLRQLLIQVTACALAAFAASAGILAIACLVIQAVSALAIAWLTRQPVWWRIIHTSFVPSLVLAQAAQLPPAWYLVAFAGASLVFWSTYRTQVPLYLSGESAWRAVAAEIPAAARCIDLGSGLGGLLAYLRAVRGDVVLSGVECAPLPYVLSCLRLHGCGIDLRYGDFWRQSLAPFDAVHAFLSPVPMPQLWVKANREMAVGSLFLSLEFPVPGVLPIRVIAVDAARSLYVYRIESPTHG